ncbi:MAG: DEAD/DEAH box helicase [Desulfobacterales bacterium]|nr:MAG: DEAD/DEAH box helicase [Desulfobacterales bacterium]
MSRHKQHFPKSKRRIPKKREHSNLKPGADVRLKRVFAAIGVPPTRVFTPDPFQIKALNAVEHTDCLVTAPTGAGKTWIAVQAIDRIRKQHGRAWYACPLKALSNAKYAEFSDIFGSANVGILTGDHRENTNAPIIVGTTEILRNQLYDAMHRGESLPADFVVLDEAHFLGDEERGVVWEEIMIYLPARIPLLLLSATIGNAGQIADWLESIRSTDCAVVEETTRPVSLFPLLLHPSGTVLPLIAPAKSGRRPQLDKKVQHILKSRSRHRIKTNSGSSPFGEILRVMKKYDLLPAIFFLKSRADCDRALDSCRDNLISDPSRQARIRQEVAGYVQQMPHLATHRQLWHLEHLAVGAHHAGQLPSWKLMLEGLMTRGLLDAVFATSTVAAGVNFPARTVVFLNSDRFNGKQFLPLTATEFHQMTGRAGRRGMDNIGFALLIPDKFMDVRLMARLLHEPPSDVVSQIKINFSMVLNLLLSHTPTQIEELLRKSFANYLIRHSRQKKGSLQSHEYLWRDFLRHLNFLKTTGYVTQENELTPDGRWASQLRVDQPLLIAEGFRRGIFPQSDPDILAAIIACFVSERDADDRISKKLIPDALAIAFSKVTRGLTTFAGKMIQRNFEVRPLLLRPAATVCAWAREQSWESVLRIAEIEEGDLATLILRTADNLRHICNLKDVFPEAAATAVKSIEKILREPVANNY